MPAVLFTASTWSHIAHFHRPYLRAFHDLGWQVHAACGGASLTIPEADACFSVPFEKKMTAPANFRAQACLRALMTQHHYDLVITHTSLAAFFTRRAASALRSRPAVVNVAHGYLFDDETPPVKKAVLALAERLTASQTDLLLTMNDYDTRFARRYRLGCRVEQIPGMGVDFSRFPAVSSQERRSLRQERGIAPDAFVLLYAAEFSKRKSQSTLLRAMSLLPKRVVLALPGQGTLLDECRHLARDLGLKDRVLFPGYCADMAPWYALADCAVSASRSEGLPFNIMEAMHASLPVVATAVKGHTDLVTPGQTGFLFPYGDETSFAAAIEQLLSHPDRTAAMGRAAARSAEPYALDRVLPQVMELYLSAVQ